MESGALTAAEGEAGSTILAGLTRMTEALADRPAANPARRAQLAGEMETAFVSQSRLMNLTSTSECLTRLPAEARKARVALEARIDRLGKDIAEAEKAGCSGSGRALLLRERLEMARVEKSMIQRFDGNTPIPNVAADGTYILEALGTFAGDGSGQLIEPPPGYVPPPKN